MKTFERLLADAFTIDQMRDPEIYSISPTSGRVRKSDTVFELCDLWTTGLYRLAVHLGREASATTDEVSSKVGVGESERGLIVQANAQERQGQIVFDLMCQSVFGQVPELAPSEPFAIRSDWTLVSPVPNFKGEITFKDSTSPSRSFMDIVESCLLNPGNGDVKCPETTTGFFPTGTVVGICESPTIKRLHLLTHQLYEEIRTLLQLGLNTKYLKGWIRDLPMGVACEIPNKLEILAEQMRVSQQLVDELLREKYGQETLATLRITNDWNVAIVGILTDTLRDYADTKTRLGIGRWKVQVTLPRFVIPLITRRDQDDDEKPEV